MNPGIYDDITPLQYHTGPGVSKSGLDLLRKSPAHYWHRYVSQRAEVVADEPEAADDEPDDLVSDDDREWATVGRALHALVLEPHAFDRRFVVRPTFAGKGSVAARKEWREQNRDKGVLSAAVAAHIVGMRDALMAHPAARAIFGGDGEAERSYYSIDPATGLLCRCRPDRTVTRGGRRIACDLKSARDASPRRWTREADNYRYHVQAAWYRDVMAACGDPIDDFVFVVVEKEPPYAVGCYMLCAETTELGRVEYREDLALLSECEHSGIWPGYTQRFEVLSFSPYRLSRRD